MLTRADLLNDWTVTGARGEQGYDLRRGLAMEYPAPEGSVGWYPIGFERGHDAALDVMGWHGLELTLRVGDDSGTGEAGTVAVEATACFRDGRRARATLSLAGPGEHEAVLLRTDFELETSLENAWRFLYRVELAGDAELLSAVYRRGQRLHVHADVRGRAGEPGEAVVYAMTAYNCTDASLSVDVRQLFEGWESLVAELKPARFALEPGGRQLVTATVRVHERMVPGGHESTVLRFVANGDGASAARIELKTLRRLPHPYIYHNREQWRATREKIERYPKFRPGYERIVADADAWRPKPPVAERDYCYDTFEEHGIMSAAYAYALTGEREYAEKVAAFLRYFIDEETGYPSKLKGCSQSYVQEGHFFQHLAIPYDIIRDASVLTPEEHRGVEKTFRLYMDTLDHHLRQGHISNWLLSEITGALYCALAIEDIERALRFVYGPGGTVEQLRCGLFNDGWWHECSVGYNTWVASMAIHTAHALLPFGYNLLHERFRIPFNEEVHATYGGRSMTVKHGMYNRKWGGNRKSYVCIKDMFDATIPFLDDRGVLFGISDSEEKKLGGVHFGSTYDLAYAYYRDPAYVPVIRRGAADPIFGHGELPEFGSEPGRGKEPGQEPGPESGSESEQEPVSEPVPASMPKEVDVARGAYADNIGLAMLRSRSAGREQRERIQAVLRYGSHGYAHGHFDRTQLLSVMRYGRSFYNPEHVWWGYHHFMYKFYVQNSMTKNMVVVDGKMQEPSDSKRVLFYEGEALQAAAVETTARWAYPPYGGMIYREGETLEERCRMNACTLPPVEGAPPYGEMSGFTEPIRQRRVMAVTDDYIVLFDYVQGEREHRFDSLFQIKGFRGLEAEKLTELGHRGQWTEEPLSDARFVTDCRRYETEGASIARFVTVFGEGEDLRGTRTAYNEPGYLKMDVHSAWPRQAEHIVGRAAEDHGIAIPFEYRVEVDGVVKAEGGFGAWLLGEGRCEVPLRGAKTLRLAVFNHPTYNEQKYPQRTKQGLFWGEAYLKLEGGGRRKLSELPLVYDNIDTGRGYGRDYEGGRVTIVGDEYPDAIPTSPADHEREGGILVDLTGLEAVAFVGLIGADAFPGDEDQRRMTYGIRTRGRIGRYITVIEPYEADPVVASATARDENTVEVTLRNGRTQTLSVSGIDREDVSVRFAEYREGRLTREEATSG